MQPLALELIQNMLMCCTLLKVIIIPAMYAIWRKDKLKNLNLFFKISVIWKTVGNSDSAAGLNHVVSLDLGKSKKATFLILKIFSNMEFCIPAIQRIANRCRGNIWICTIRFPLKIRSCNKKNAGSLALQKSTKKNYAIKPFKPLVLNSSEIWIPLEIRSCQCTKKNRELRNSR